MIPLDNPINWMIIGLIIAILLIWFFIESAVKSGTKKAIYEILEELKFIHYVNDDNDPLRKWFNKDK